MSLWISVVYLLHQQSVHFLPPSGVGIKIQDLSGSIEESLLYFMSSVSLLTTPILRNMILAVFSPLIFGIIMTVKVIHLYNQQ